MYVQRHEAPSAIEPSSSILARGQGARHRGRDRAARAERGVGRLVARAHARRREPLRRTHARRTLVTNARGDVAIAWSTVHERGRTPHTWHESSVLVTFGAAGGRVLTRTIWRRAHTIVVDTTAAIDARGELSVAWAEQPERRMGGGPVTIRARGARPTDGGSRLRRSAAAARLSATLAPAQATAPTARCCSHGTPGQRSARVSRGALAGVRLRLRVGPRRLAAGDAARTDAGVRSGRRGARLRNDRTAAARRARA